MPDTYTGDAPRTGTNGIKVGCANGSQMQATWTDVLAIPQLPWEARKCHKFKKISLPLIYVPKLCQAGCRVNFSRDKVDVTLMDGNHVLTGIMDPMSNLYLFPIPTRSNTHRPLPTGHTVANAYSIRLMATLSMTAGSWDTILKRTITK